MTKENTKLKLTDILPLSCSRSGNCCFGNKVMINPWELAKLSVQNEISVNEFVNKHTEWSGIRLKFDGELGYNKKKACSQYMDGIGCKIHMVRPLVCRLFPLGRQTQNGQQNYIYPGKQFPCLEGCKEVLDLPHYTVAEYLIEQQTEQWEIAQDSYLEIVQLLADIAFELLLDSGLTASGQSKALYQWRLLTNETPDKLVNRIGKLWYNLIIAPNLTEFNNQPQLFCEQHFKLLQEQIQNSFGLIQTYEELQEASVVVMAMALLLAVSVGADSNVLANYWIEIAKNNGVEE